MKPGFTVVGILTEAPIVLAVGNGDSGGHGVILAIDASDNLGLRAASSVSAFPGGSADACQGGSASATRKCRKVGISTRVNGIPQLTGTAIMVG